MNQQKVVFKNTEGHELSGRLELPADRDPHNFAIFAHCFTCTKNLGAVRNISRALSASGFGVLRFDFTGLGESSGDFEDSNFTGQIDDLLAASSYLKENYKAPALLVGHSLGGAASLFAASQLEEVRAVATIGAPSDPEHVKNLLKSNLDEIQQKGQAVVNIGGRDFTIKKQFLDDIREQPTNQVLASIKASILIMHSPQDRIVGITNAENIYKAASHPKSFISLDGADHLLSNKSDSRYVGAVISGWASRYIEIPEPPQIESSHDAVASLDGDDGYTTYIKAGNHRFVADEPDDLGGNDYGPSPYQLVSAGLSACTAMTLHMYARRKEWPLDNVEVHSSHGKEHIVDCRDCEDPDAKVDTFRRSIRIEGNLDEKQRKRLIQIANKCPVHRTLSGEAQILTNEQK